jgi:hypothetical protein
LSERKLQWKLRKKKQEKNLKERERERQIENPIKLFQKKQTIITI